MTISNLTVTDKGEIVIADFDAEDCHIHFYISRKALIDSQRIFGNDLHTMVESYLNQNLK